MWIQTYNGKAFDLLNPSPRDIDSETIAVGLSRMCRFGGHCKEFYSVAQHSVLVCNEVARMGKGNLLLPALLHDAHEIYWGFGDIVQPAFRSLPEAVRVVLNGRRQRVDRVVAKRFGFDPALFESDEVKRADELLLSTEKRDLMLPAPKPWAPLPPPLDYNIVPMSMGAAYKYFKTALRRWGS